MAESQVAPGTGWRITPMNLHAQPTGATREATKPFVLPEHAVVQTPFPVSEKAFDPDQMEVLLKDAEGGVVERLRFNKLPGRLLPPQ